MPDTETPAAPEPEAKAKTMSDFMLELATLTQVLHRDYQIPWEHSVKLIDVGLGYALARSQVMAEQTYPFPVEIPKEA